MPFDFGIFRREMTVADVLRDARRRIENRENWVQGVYETFGARFCSAGAIRMAGRRLRRCELEHRAYKALLEVANRRGFLNVEIMNDRSTHEEVLSAFDDAIASAAAMPDRAERAAS